MMRRDRTLQTYEALAHWYERCGQVRKRDWFLVLAADQALTLGWPDEAERLRQQLLLASPHHLLRPFASFADALASPQVQSYIAYLRSHYPPERAEQLLAVEQAAVTGAKTPLEKQHVPPSPSARPPAPPLAAPPDTCQPVAGSAPPGVAPPKAPSAVEEPRAGGRPRQPPAAPRSGPPATLPPGTTPAAARPPAPPAELLFLQERPLPPRQLTPPAPLEDNLTPWMVQALLLLLLLAVLLLISSVFLGPLLSSLHEL